MDGKYPQRRTRAPARASRGGMSVNIPRHKKLSCRILKPPPPGAARAFPPAVGGNGARKGMRRGRLMRCETRVLDRFRLNQGRLRPRVDKERQDFLSTVCGYLLIKYQFFITAPHHHWKTSIMGHSFLRSFFSISEKNRCFL